MVLRRVVNIFRDSFFRLFSVIRFWFFSFCTFFGNDDVDRIMNAFLRQFNGMFSKFSFLNFNARCFLFNSFCSSFYGMETWVETLREYQLKKISVAYHKAVKRVGGFEVWNSNHDACEAVGVLLFRHLWAKRLLFFWHRLCLSRSPCTANLRYYFASKSCLYAKIDALFSDKYDIKVALNPLCAINSRIYFVQKHEPRSYYVPELQLLDSQNAWFIWGWVINWNYLIHSFHWSCSFNLWSFMQYASWFCTCYHWSSLLNND